MQNARLLVLAVACLAAVVAGLWYWSSGAPTTGPTPDTPQQPAGPASGDGTAPTPETGSTPITRRNDEDLIEYRVTRSEQGFDEACGIATADFRVRRHIVIPANAENAVIAWDPAFGEAAVLFSDRRPPLVIGSRKTSVRLRPLPDNAVSIEHAGTEGCELLTRSVSPADWVFRVAESLQNPQLAAVTVDPAALVRAVYREAGKVSDWSNGTNVAGLAPLHKAVSVHVETATGHPVADAVVDAIDDQGRVRDRGLTDEHGEALLRVPDGWQRWVADRDGMVAGDSRDMHGARIVLQQARSIDISLSVQGDGPVAQGKVTWHGTVERSALVAAGRARLRDVAKDPVRVLLADGGPWAETEIPGKVVQHTWEIEATDSLTGEVQGVPAEIGTTFVLLHGAGARAPAVIGPLGTFRFGNVPARALELRVVVRTHAGFERTLKTVQAHPRTYARIVVSAAELPSGALHLDVRSSGGGACEGAWPVRLTEVDGSNRVFTGSVVDGVCDITSIPPGTYTCEISVSDWHLPYRAETTVQPLGVSSYYWELPQTVSCRMVVDGDSIAGSRCLLGLRQASQDTWIMLARDRERAHWDLGELSVGEYEFAWFGRGVAPHVHRMRVAAGHSGALSMPQRSATETTLRIEGLRQPYGEATLSLRQAGKTIVVETKGGDCSKWRLDLYPGDFEWELATEREAGSGAFEVPTGGGEILVYCR
ncbi:MAG: hypothetical protein ACE37K_23895 [Planctomycetota bacterium]